MKAHNLSAFLVFGLLAQTPDRAPRPEEWGYRPADGSAVPVNPPALTWVSDGSQYSYGVQWSKRPDFQGATTVENVRWSVYTHNRPWEPGRWHWRYRMVDAQGKTSEWSRARSFTIPATAAEFPAPTDAEIAGRIPKGHPRLFATPRELPRLREWSKGGGAEAWRRVLARADELLNAEPTPEPAVMGDSRNPETVAYWWPNRVQTLKACQEGEILAFAYLMTGDEKYGKAARRWALHLAAWNPDGPTNWKLNDEAAMPILHRLARTYDWAHAALSEEERGRVRAVMLRRAEDCWRAGQTGQGGGHLNRPYNSHGNRSWHKLAETAIALYGNEPKAVEYLRFAVDKFFAAYPVWSDDDGGWHEGLSYWAGYMVKTTWWFDVARVALGIDGFKKPFFANFGDYALYTAPPGSPDAGIGDLSQRLPSASWAFVHYFAAGARNPYWAWWAREWGIRMEHDEPVMAFLWSSMKPVEPEAPAAMPASKVFRGIGVAVLNTTLLHARDNVQVRFKSSPFGRQSHGHEPHNSFTLAAYGDALIQNNVYRDLYGSPFHKDWVWTTRAQNALLVDGNGQKPHSADLAGAIVKFESRDGVDYVAGEAAAAYEGKLRRYLRHIVFLKPGVVVVADEVEAAQPAHFQIMLHAPAAFTVDEAGQRLRLERAKAGLAAEYYAAAPLKLKQWTGYEPEPDWKYLNDPAKTRIPPQWHVEAATAQKQAAAVLLTVLRPYRKGAAPAEARVSKAGRGWVVEAAGKRVRIGGEKEFVTVEPAK